MMKKCPDCGGQLEEGVNMDFTYGGVAIQRYAKASIPQKPTVNATNETKFEDIRRVVSYRCTKCNRIFHYAQNLVLGKTLWDSQKRSLPYILFIAAILIMLALLISFGLIRYF